jgi:hypothetical protein
MNTAPSTLIRRFAAAVAAGTTTFALFSAVVNLSEPQRSGLIAASAARQAEQAQAQAQAQARARRQQQTSVAAALPVVGHAPAEVSD